jgi:indole-3-glycerol phosphate synthase
MNTLERIIERKRDEVARLRSAPGEAALRAAAESGPEPRGFVRALAASPSPRVIAEFKRASPSKGEIRPGASSAEIARLYAAGGAAALSVLTDREFFCGELADVEAARGACELPILRKDFTIDPIQLLEARAAGADAILLIVAALEPSQLIDLHALARELLLDVLVEVHDRAELERALALPDALLGINNRDLRSFRTDVSTTRELLAFARGRPVVSESGLDDPSVIAELAAEGVHGFLIGEALMRADDPGHRLRELRRGA